MTQDINKLLEKLEGLDFENLYHDDFFHTWDKSQDELEAIFTVADTLRAMREKIFLQKSLTQDLLFHYLEIIQQEQDFHTHQLQIC